MTTEITSSQPAWMHIDHFHASTTYAEKIWRVLNQALFAATAYSLYAIASGDTKNIPHIAYYLCLALAVRKIAATLIGQAVYPAITGTKYSFQEEGENQKSILENNGYIVKKISLSKSGTTYDAAIITRPDLMKQGKWSMHGFGNQMCMEDVMRDVAENNADLGCNTLLVNGPSVGNSGGFPTPYQFGAGFEAGLQFLEKEAQATHLIFKGLSLGNGMVSNAVLMHDFAPGLERGVNYIGVADRSFGRLSEVAAALVGNELAARVGSLRIVASLVRGIVEWIFYLAGAELDGIGAAKKLSTLDIPQIVIQHDGEKGSDGVIPDEVGLKAKILSEPHRKKTQNFVFSPYITHNGSLPKHNQDQFEAYLKQLLNK
jgi:hypothetical protein